MKVNSKIGIIVDGYWKVISSRNRRSITPTCHRVIYTLQNIYNQRTIEVEERSLKKIIEGTQTVAYFIRRAMPKNKKTFIYH